MVGKEQLLPLLTAFLPLGILRVQDVAPAVSPSGAAQGRLQGSELLDDTLRGDMGWGKGTLRRFAGSRVYFLQVSPSWTYKSFFLLSSAPICSKGSGLEHMNVEPQHRSFPRLFLFPHQCLRFL